MNTRGINEVALALGFTLALAALVAVTIVCGSDALAATGLRDIAIGLAGALAGARVPK